MDAARSHAPNRSVSLTSTIRARGGVRTDSAMKMEKRENFETFEEQERRAQQELNVAALIKAAAIAGLAVFLVPAGPWMSSEMMTNVMGRGMGTQAAIAFVLHFAVAFIYAWIIALCIYRLPLGAGVGFGALLALPLWAVNYAVFAAGAGFRGNEVHAAIAHFMFCLFFSVAYRGMAVPRPRRKDGGEAQASGPGGASQARAGGLGT